MVTEKEWADMIRKIEQYDRSFIDDIIIIGKLKDDTHKHLDKIDDIDEKAYNRYNKEIDLKFAWFTREMIRALDLHYFKNADRDKTKDALEDILNEYTMGFNRNIKLFKTLSNDIKA